MADLVISESFLQKIDTDRKVHSVSRGLGLLITPFNDPLAGITRNWPIVWELVQEPSLSHLN